MTASKLPSLRLLHLILALVALVSMFLPWGYITLHMDLDHSPDRVNVIGWAYPCGQLLALLLAAGLVISLLESAYLRGAGCAHVALFIANLLAGISSSWGPFTRGNMIANILGFHLGFFLFILFHAVSIMLSSRTTDAME